MTTITDAIRDTLAQGLVDGLSRDQQIIGLVSTGMSLNAATKAYVEWAKEEGITQTLTSYKDEALAYLAKAYKGGKGWDAMAVKAEVNHMAAEYDIAESTARDYCKAYSEQLGVTHPVLDPRTAIFQWFKDNTAGGQLADHDAYIEFACKELGRSRSNANEYWKGYELHLFLNGGII